MDAPRENVASPGSRISIYRAHASPRPVNREALLASIRTWFQTFRKTLWFRITYLVLLGVIVGQLYVFTLSPAACLVLLLIPISVFIVPYWLGERKLRRFAGNALVVFLLAILIAAAMPTQALLSQREAVQLGSFPDPASPMVLSNGTVGPYQAAPSTAFTFRVNLTTTNGSIDPNDYRVYLNLTAVRGLDFSQTSYRMAYDPGNGSATTTRNGTWYQTRLSNLTDTIYGYGFSAFDGDRNWTFAGPDFGPVTASGWTYYGFFLYATGFSQITILAIIMYFAILFLWWYSMRAREARAKALGRAPQEPKEAEKETPKAPPSSGGKASRAAAFTCTNCGADVSASDEKCPACGAVFED